MRYVIALGSNLGDPEASVCWAMDAVESRLGSSHSRRSSLYRTEPVGGPEQPDYVNAVIVVEVDADPRDVLRTLHEIEAQQGRVRDVPWGPRTLDLDIIIAGDTVSDDPDLSLPHPRAHERAFVLVPWHEVEPDAVLGDHGPIKALVECGFRDQDIEVIHPGEGTRS